eukprot:2575431-Rhodomonas_salina.2
MQHGIGIATQNKKALQQCQHQQATQRTGVVGVGGRGVHEHDLVAPCGLSVLKNAHIPLLLRFRQRSLPAWTPCTLGSSSRALLTSG